MHLLKKITSLYHFFQTSATIRHNIPFSLQSKRRRYERRNEKTNGYFSGRRVRRTGTGVVFRQLCGGSLPSVNRRFRADAQIPEKLKPVYDKAIYALRQMLKDDKEKEQVDLEECVRTLIGLHHFADCLPFMNKEYVEVDDDAYTQTSQQIAQRILPILKDFACRTQFPPDYFCRIYMDMKEQCNHWDAALQEMIFAFEYLANPPKVHEKNDIKRMQTGLHLFAEYLQEMYNV